MKYSDELKARTVENYLSGKGSLLEICRRYKIRTKTLLREWIKWYNGHMGDSRTKGQKHVAKGRKTTQEERAEIVAFCIEHGKDYGLTRQQHLLFSRQKDRKKNLGIQGGFKHQLFLAETIMFRLI